MFNLLTEIFSGFIRMQKSSLAFFILMLLPINRNNMGGSSPDQWDNRMLDHLKNFDLSSPEVRQQFGELNTFRVTWVFLKTHEFYENPPELCNPFVPICGSFF